ncbi:MAG: hypothetical protein ACRD0A_10640 [Acidimicrobiales bacterium]
MVTSWVGERGARSVRRDYGVLRAILNYAVAGDMIGRSPCRGINLPEVKPLRRHVVDGNELARLAGALGGVGQYGPMVYLGAVMGLRWGEVAGSRVGRVEFVAGTVEIAETVVRGRRGLIGFGEPKSDAGRRRTRAPLPGRRRHSIR